MLVLLNTDAEITISSTIQNLQSIQRRIRIKSRLHSIEQTSFHETIISKSVVLSDLEETIEL